MSRLTVFYSWQSDTEPRTNRSFIRDALKAAIADLDLEDAERPEIDQDTSGVLGAPVIAETIFSKIRVASVFVADVTLTGATSNGKKLCNSNVVLELGYALRALGDDALLNVMNTHYGPPEALPFDLAHRRWPLQYALAPDATNGERLAIKSALAAQLTPILKAYLAVQARRNSVAAVDPNHKADVRADFVRYGSSKYKFKVSNWGPSAARNVRVAFPDGNPGVLIDEAFPMELMEHHQSVEVPAIVSMETRGKHRVNLLWDDDTAPNREKVVYATI
jgi:hypothetical protein